MRESGTSPSASRRERGAVRRKKGVLTLLKIQIQDCKKKQNKKNNFEAETHPVQRWFQKWSKDKDIYF